MKNIIQKKMLIKKFLEQLNSITMESEFREQIDKILRNIDFNLTNEVVAINNSTLSVIQSPSNTSHTISISNNSVVFHTYYTDRTKNESDTYDKTGKQYRVGENLIIKYCDSEIRSHQNYQEIKTEETTSVFDRNYVETSKTTRTDIKNYAIKNGIKSLIQYKDTGIPNPFYNNVQTGEYVRTPNGNVIVIQETKYYDDTHKKYNERIYYIGYNSSERYIHTYGIFTAVDESLYKDYVDGKITEEELFKHFVKLRRGSIVVI